MQFFMILPWDNYRKNRLPMGVSKYNNFLGENEYFPLVKFTLLN